VGSKILVVIYADQLPQAEVPLALRSLMLPLLFALSFYFFFFFPALLLLPGSEFLLFFQEIFLWHVHHVPMEALTVYSAPGIC